MIVLPAIDIKNGRCVRLVRGDFVTAHQVAANALQTAAGFRAAGASWLHMVDLDGAKTGTRENRALILRVAAQSGLRVEVGGGIRSMEDIRDYLEHGAARVVLGSAALETSGLAREAAARFGVRVAVGVDARDGMVATQGWLHVSSVSYLEFARRMEQDGVGTLIFTDIGRDGTLSGPNLEQLRALAGAVSCNIIASGGIRNPENIQGLQGMGLYGVICGKSLYSGTLDLGQAISLAGPQN